MSLSTDVTVIDIGSRTISAYAAERLSDDAFAVKTSCEVEYDGYSEGEWVNREGVINSIYRILDKVERSAGKIKTLYVGIPADFCVVRTAYDKMSFPKPRRATKADVREIYDLNDPFVQGQYERIQADPIFFLNDRGQRLIDPTSCRTSCLKVRISYVGASGESLEFLRAALFRHGIKEIKFLLSEFMAARHLFTEEERERGIILADIGYLATSVLHVTGDALLEMRTFALGGEMLASGLANRFEVPYRVAVAMLPKVHLGYKDEGEYSLKYEASTYSLPIAEVNALVRECLDFLAVYVKKAIASFRYEYPDNAPIYLTGGGFSEVRHAREYLAKALDRRVEFVQPETPNFAKPYYSTAVGLIREALRLEKKERFGFLKKLFK